MFAMFMMVATTLLGVEVHGERKYLPHASIHRYSNPTILISGYAKI